jgi:DNA-binding MarR family transcriptional regulator
MRGE